MLKTSFTATRAGHKLSSRHRGGLQGSHSSTPQHWTSRTFRKGNPTVQISSTFSSKRPLFATHANDDNAAIYSEDPLLYDLAFSFRDFSQEVDFLLEAAAQRSATGKPPAVLELAAGPGRHAIEFARRGLEVVALDCEESMVELGHQRAKEAGVELQYMKADMSDFDAVPTQDGKVSLACLLLGSSCHLLTNEAIIGCFKSTASVLAKDGVFVLECPHPNEVFGVGDMTGDAWDVERGDETLLVEWGREGDYFDPITQVLERTVGFSMLGKDGAVLSSREDIVKQRLSTAVEIDALARASGLQVDGFYGSMDLAIPLDMEDEAFRMVVVMRPSDGEL